MTSTVSAPTPSATSLHLAVSIAVRTSADAAVKTVTGETPFVYADIQDDINNVIRGIAIKYTDPSRMELQTEELVAEGLAKVAVQIHKGILTKFAGRRAELFAFLKTCINNHLKGIVGRCRFTIKRTGVRPPPRGEINWNAPAGKPEISIDDPDVHLQLPDQQPTVGGLGHDLYEIMTPLEALVLHQLEQPNDLSALHAILQSHIKTKFGERPHNIDIVDACHAKGLGMPLDLFLSVKETIREKTRQIMHESAPDQRVAAVTALSKLFAIYIPRPTEPIVVRRLLTVAARANYTLVTPEVASLLELAGAKAPKLEGDGALNCYGVLYSATHRTCGACALKGACQRESANYGLGTVFLSTDILPAAAAARVARTSTDEVDQPQAPVSRLVSKAPAAIVVEQESEAVRSTVDDAPAEPAAVIIKPKSTKPKVAAPVTPPVPASGRDDDIVAYLAERYKPVLFDGETYYKHATAHPDGRVKHIFWVGDVPGFSQCAVRFCWPSAAMQKILVKVRRSYYAPADTTAADLRAMVDRHANYIWNNR